MIKRFLLCFLDDVVLLASLITSSLCWDGLQAKGGMRIRISTSNTILYFSVGKDWHAHFRLERVASPSVGDANISTTCSRVIEGRSRRLLM